MNDALFCIFTGVDKKSLCMCERKGIKMMSEPMVRENKESCHTEIDVKSKERKDIGLRLLRLTYWFADEMFKEEEAELQENEQFKLQCQNEPDRLQIRISAHENNAQLMKACLKDVRDSIRFVKDVENDIEEWQIAGINGMLDYCSKARISLYDLPEAIKGVLCMEILEGAWAEKKGNRAA